MSRNTRIALIVTAVLIVLCVCACAGAFLAFRFGGQAFLQNMVTTDPQKASVDAKEIANYTLPPGYHEEGIVNLYLAKFVMISEGDPSASITGRPVIMLLQMLTDVRTMDKEQIRQQMEQSMRRSVTQGNYALTLVDHKTIRIDQQDVNIFTYEGTDDKGVKVRELISDPFSGKQGTLLVMIFGPTSAWNQSELDTFIQSIH